MIKNTFSSVCATFLILALFPHLLLAATAPAGKVILGVIDTSSKEMFDKDVLPVLSNELKNCKNCEISNMTPYDENGQFAEAKLKDALVPKEGAPQVLFLGWNARARETNQDVQAAITTLREQGTVIVGTAGAGNSKEYALMLNRTVLGKIDNIIILGSLTEKEKLIDHSNYGPEMLTALRPNRNISTPNANILVFTARLVQAYDRKGNIDWVNVLKNKRVKLKKIWPDDRDLLN